MFGDFTTLCMKGLKVFESFLNENLYHGFSKQQRVAGKEPIWAWRRKSKIRIIQMQVQRNIAGK